MSDSPLPRRERSLSAAARFAALDAIERPELFDAEDGWPEAVDAAEQEYERRSRAGEQHRCRRFGRGERPTGRSSASRAVPANAPLPKDAR